MADVPAKPASAAASGMSFGVLRDMAIPSHFQQKQASSRVLSLRGNKLSEIALKVQRKIGASNATMRRHLMQNNLVALLAEVRQREVCQIDLLRPRQCQQM